MNSIQKYVLNSLFLRKQITEEKLAQALDIVFLSNEPAIDSFLTVLVTDKTETEQMKVYITGDMRNRIQIIKLIMDVFNTKLKETKDLVDEYITEDNLTFPLNLIYSGKIEGLNIDNIKAEFACKAYTLTIH